MSARRKVRQYRVIRSFAEYHVTDGSGCVLDHTRKVTRAQARAEAARLNAKEKGRN